MDWGIARKGSRQTDPIVIAVLVAGCLLWSRPAKAGADAGVSPLPATRADPAAGRIAELIERLGSGVYQRREQATRDLVGMGVPALEALRAAADDKDVERATRARQAIGEIQENTIPPESYRAQVAAAIGSDQGPRAVALEWIAQRRSRVLPYLLELSGKAAGEQGVLLRNAIFEAWQQGLLTPGQKTAMVDGVLKVAWRTEPARSPAGDRFVVLDVTGLANQSPDSVWTTGKPWTFLKATWKAQLDGRPIGGGVTWAAESLCVYLPEGLAPGAHALKAVVEIAEDLGRWRHTVTAEAKLAPGEPATATSQPAWPMAKIAGRVVDRQGRPAPGLPISTASYTMGLAGRWAPTPPIVTDSQGRFEALVPYGEIGYQVVAGQWGIYHRSSVAGPTFPGREPVELLLDPPGSPLPIRGTVTAPAGQAVSGLTVTIVGEYGDRWQSLTDPYGRFQIAGFGELRQSVAVVRSGGLAAPLRLIDRRGPVTNLALALAPAATLAGTVRDTQDNTPIPGATVTILPPYANDFRMQATTGRDGRYLIEGIPPGPYHVTAIAPGRFYPLPRGMVSELPETALPAGATVTADLAMQRSVLLRGRVVDVSGRPVPGAMVCAQGQNMGDYPDPHVGTRTGGDGQFLLDGGQAYQLITLAAFDPRAGQSQMEVCPPAPGRIVDGLVLKTHGSMRVRGIVTDAGGRGIPGVTCLAYHASETAATTGPDGRFDLGRIPLPSGGKPLLSLRAPRPGHTGAGTPPEAPWFFHRRVTLDPVADDDAQLKLSLEPTVLLRFAGRVTDARGAPVANARVWVFTGEADEETWQETIHPQTMMGRDWKVPRPGYNMGAVQTGPDGRWALTAVRERGTRPFEQGGAPWSRFCVGVVTSSGDKNVFVRDIAGPPGGKPIDVPINLDAPPATRPATRPGA